MAEQSFPYRHHGKGLYPTIPVRLFHLSNEIACDGIVDSGSNYSIFQPWVAEAIGIPWMRGERMTLSTVSDKAEIFLFDLRMQAIGNLFNTRVGFARMGTSFNILGRVGFFERHEITFKEKEKRIVLKELA
ncbi:MAG: hypothetical protein V1708_03470 [Candidatus Micrarchaeota archaeon]